MLETQTYSETYYPLHFYTFNISERFLYRTLPNSSHFGARLSATVEGYVRESLLLFCEINEEKKKTNKKSRNHFSSLPAFAFET